MGGKLHGTGGRRSAERLAHWQPRRFGHSAREARSARAVGHRHRIDCSRRAERRQRKPSADCPLRRQRQCKPGGRQGRVLMRRGLGAQRRGREERHRVRVEQSRGANLRATWRRGSTRGLLVRLGDRHAQGRRPQMPLSATSIGDRQAGRPQRQDQRVGAEHSAWQEEARDRRRVRPPVLRGPGGRRQEHDQSARLGPVLQTATQLRNPAMRPSSSPVQLVVASALTRPINDRTLFAFQARAGGTR